MAVTKKTCANKGSEASHRRGWGREPHEGQMKGGMDKPKGGKDGRGQGDEEGTKETKFEVNGSRS